jgi:hypothetical protein
MVDGVRRLQDQSDQGPNYIISDQGVEAPLISKHTYDSSAEYRPGTKDGHGWHEPRSDVPFPCRLCHLADRSGLKKLFSGHAGLVTGMFFSGTEKTMVVDFHCGRPLKSSTQKLLRIPSRSSSYAIRGCHDIPASQGFASASFSKLRLL